MDKNIIRILIGLIGEGLIVCVFFVLLPLVFFGNEQIQWLDFAVASLVYWLWILNSFFPLLNLKDPSQKGVGGLGIKWIGLIWYTIFALGFMGVGLINSSEFSQISFKWQIVVQGFILFFFILMMLFSWTASQKTEEVFHEEKAKKQEKKNIKNAIQGLLYDVEDAGAPSDIVNRVRNLSDETRYLTPNDTDEALMLDNRIENSCQSIKYALSNFKMNETQIMANLAQLERDLQRRKSV